MRRILLVVLCVAAAVYGQNRGSRRFTPSPFLEGQDLGFLSFRGITPRPGLGRLHPSVRRRQPTPSPALGVNDIDDGVGVVSAAKQSTRRVPAVKTKRLPQRQPQRTRTVARRRRPTRVQATQVTATDLEKATKMTEASVPATARPARFRATSKASDTSTLSLQQQVEALKKQAQPSSPGRRRSKGRRVKKIRRIINPDGDDDDDDIGADDENKTENSEVTDTDVSADKSSELTEADDESPITTTRSPLVLRRQKKIFRQRGGSRGRGNSSRRRLPGRRRLVTQAPLTTTEALIADPTTVPTVSISTSSPFEPFPLDENEVDNLESGEEASESTKVGNSGVTLTRVVSSAGGKAAGASSSSFSSSSSSSSDGALTSISQASSSSGPEEDNSANEVESSPAVNEVSSSKAAASARAGPRLASRGSARGTARGSSTFTRTRGSGRGRARDSGRQRVPSATVTSSSSSSSSARGTSRRQFARRRRPSSSAAANAITTATSAGAVTTPEAATTTTEAITIDADRAPTTEQPFKTDGLTFTNSLENGTPSHSQGSLSLGVRTTAAPVTTFGGFQPVTSSGSFRVGSGAVTRFGATPQSVPPVVTPTSPAVSTQFFDSTFGSQGFGQSTPASPMLLINTIGGGDFRQTSAPKPATFLSAGSRGAGSGRPNFGSFSFGTNSASSSFGGVSSFDSISATVRPTFQPTPAKTTILGSSSSSSASGDARFGLQSVANTGGFRPISFTTRQPAPTFQTNTNSNVRISSNGAFSFGTGLSSPAASGPDFSVSGFRTTTPSSAFPTAKPFVSFGGGPSSTPAQAPAVLTEAAQFFGSQPGSTAQTSFRPLNSPGVSVSTFTHSSTHPAPSLSSGSFSFGTAATEANTLVPSVGVSPTTPAAAAPTGRPRTFLPATESPEIRPARPSDQTLISNNQQQHAGQKPPASSLSSSSSSSFLSPSSSSQSSSRRTAGSGRSFGSSSSSNTIFGAGFEFQQKNGIITQSSHLRGYDTRLPTFHENVVISDPVFSSKDIKPGFTCEGRPYGYYADEANDCRIFHICQPVDVSSVSTFYTRYSFFCGAETRFDQSKLSCLHDKDAMPCSDSASWLFRNDEFGVQEERSLEEQFQREVQAV